MSTPGDPVQERLDDLESRLRAVERRLASEAVLHRATPAADEAPSSSTVLTPRDQAWGTLPLAPPVAPTPGDPPPIPFAAEALASFPSDQSAPPAAPAAPPTSPAPPAAPPLDAEPPRPTFALAPTPPTHPYPPPGAPPVFRVPRPAARPVDMERLIGGKWFAAAGALIVVVGIVLFLKFAYDQGWMNRLPPAGKCLAGAGFGVALLIAGEVIRRKLNALASAGVSAAGLGVLFAVSYAAHAVYGLIPPAGAFLLLTACVALGIGLALRTGLLFMAVLALAGGYLSPVLLRTDHPSPYVLPVYLMGLLAVGLLLAARRPRPFRPLRAVAWWGTVLLGTGWAAATWRDHPAIAVVFFTAFWLAEHGELVWSASHGGGRRGPGGGPEPVTAPALVWRRAAPVMTSFSTSAWSVGMAVMALRSSASGAEWLPAAAGFAATAMLSMTLAGNLRVLTDPPRTDAERLGAGLALQAGALLFATIALALAGWTAVAVWLALGVATIAAGRWIGSRALAVYGVVALGVASCRLVVFDWWGTPGAMAGFAGAGLEFTPWMLLMGLGATAWIGAAVLLAGAGRPLGRWAPIVATGIGLLLLDGSVLNIKAAAPSIGGAWLLFATLAMVAARFERRLALGTYGAAWLAGLAALLLVAGPRNEGELPPVFTTAGLIVSRWTPLLIATAAVCIGAAWASVTRHGPVTGVGGAGVAGAAAGVALLGASLVHPDSAASPLWGAWLGIGTLALGAHGLERRLAFDVAGLGLVGMAVCAWAVGFTPEWWRSAAAPLLHPGLGAAVLTMGVLAAAAWLLRGGRWGSTLPHTVAVATVAAVVLFFAASSLEASRWGGIATTDPTGRRGAVSIWWGVFAVALIVVGFRRGLAPARRAGLGLLAVAALKAVVLDLADVSAGWRIVSFIGLGLLMLAVAVGYGRANAKRPGPAPE